MNLHVTSRVYTPATRQPIESQAGVALLLAILILSAITAISFSLAAIALIEIRAAGDVQRTEPALYSDHGVTEEAIFGIKRQVPAGGPAPSPLYFGPATVPCATDYVAYSGPVSSFITTQTKVCDIATQTDIIDRIAPASASFGTAKRYYLYNPTNAGLGPGGYTALSLKNAGTVDLVTWVCKLKEDCTNPQVGDSGWLPGGDGVTILTPGSTRAFTIDSNESYEVAIAKTVASATDGFIEVITAPKGLPYLSKRAVDIKSDVAGLSRILRVFVPTR